MFCFPKSRINENGGNLVEDAVATRQLAILATGIAFYDILVRACAEIKTYVLRLFDF